MTRLLPKKQRPACLLRLLEEGPSFGPVTSEDQAQKLYRLWARSWGIGELKALMPQLREENRVTLHRPEAGGSMSGKV